MKIIYDLDSFQPQSDVILTIGTFDGVHRGHQYLLRQLVACAQQTQRMSAVLTFNPHPRAVLHPEMRPTCLSTPEERAAIIGPMGVDLLVLLPFTRELADTPSADFIRALYERLCMRELWVGTNFVMGKQRDGDIVQLQALAEQLGYTLRTIEPLGEHDKPISSTRIRVLLAKGQLDEANKLLGRSYAVSAEVVKGDQRGRSLGFRTANLRIPADRAMPTNGVYAVWGLVEGERIPGVANVGVRPSFGAGERLLEVHLLDYANDLYGKPLTVEFVHYLRPERRFENVDALIEQIRRDSTEARALLGV